MGWLLASDFAAACAALPLVSVDIYATKLIANEHCLLLGLRKNRPAQGWWFTPGGRVRKGETVPQALARVALEELGCSLKHAQAPLLLGVWDHIYSDSAFNPNAGTHYVNLAYTLALPDLDESLLPSKMSSGAQHSQWRWQPLQKVAVAKDVHSYVKQTAEVWASSFPTKE
jgi:colanic acid biosynthesis protein WcaH